MPTNEPQLNGRIATLMNRMNRRWRALGETQGAFRGNQEQPDILISQIGSRPVVIENRYLPARQLENAAIDRLGQTLDAKVTATVGKINAVVALRSPVKFKACDNHDEVDQLLNEGVKLEYALFSGPSPSNYSRFPATGFVTGDLKDLAGFVSYASVPEDAVDKAIDALIEGISSTAAILREACELSELTKELIADQLKQDYSEQTLEIAATIMINALVYHQNLGGRDGVGNFDEIRPNGIPVTGLVQKEWLRILKKNYWSIFKIALDLLRSINPQSYAGEALKQMVETAETLHSLGVAQSHDLTGTVFQRLIADRKFLATFYTRPESATLLAHVAIPDCGNWGDAELFRNFQVADYACGTGTLIHAAYRRVNQLHLLSGGVPEKFHSEMMKNSLTACDVFAIIGSFDCVDVVIHASC